MYINNLDGTTRIVFNPKRPEVFTTVDTEDVPRLKALSWSPTTTSKRNLTRYSFGRIGKSKIMIHRLILSFPEGKQVDHIDRNGLNNTKVNLRAVCGTVNSLNKPCYRGKKNGMPKGISKRRFVKSVAYRARIRIHGELIELGTFKTLGEAVAARAIAEAQAVERLLRG